MQWAIIAELIQEFPAILSIFQKWAQGTAPTQADYETLNSLAARKAIDLMKAQLLAAGVTITDPKAIALLALVSG